MFASLYTQSTEAWDAMFTAMAAAKTSIYIEMYTFSDDTKETHDFVSLLIERSKAGVHVVMILDYLGSLYLSRTVVATLMSAGVEVLFYKYWFYRTHRKFVIIDGAVAFVGGVNIVQYAFAWKDLQVRVTGYLAVRLNAVFARTYSELGGKRNLSTLLPKKRPRLKVRAWLLEHAPLIGRKRLHEYYSAKLKAAHHHVVIITPYFIPSNWLMSEIASVAKRGVRVSIILPEHTDPQFIDHANRYYAMRLIESGVSTYFVPGMNHGKAVLIDDAECMIGSANMDPLSFERNNELGIFFTDASVVHALKQVSDMWRSEGKLFTITDYHLSIMDWVLTLMVRFFHPLL